jgi:hypothetical protein
MAGYVEERIARGWKFLLRIGLTLRNDKTHIRKGILKMQADEIRVVALIYSHLCQSLETTW